MPATRNARLGRTTFVTVAVGALALAGCSRAETAESLAPVQQAAPLPPAPATPPPTTSTDTAPPTYDVDQAPPIPASVPNEPLAGQALRSQPTSELSGTAPATTIRGAAPPAAAAATTTTGAPVTTSTTDAPSAATPTTRPARVRGTTTSSIAPDPAPGSRGRPTTTTAPPSDTATTTAPTTTTTTTTAPTTTTTTTPITTTTLAPAPTTRAPSPAGAAIVVARATVFGAAVGPADVEALIAAISSTHGGPTSDTGWVADADACQADADTRVIWWSDLRIVAERRDDTTTIVGWSFGDPRAAANLAVGAGATAPSLGLVTDGGAALGDKRGKVRDTLDDATVVSEDGSRIVVSAGSRTLVFQFGQGGRLSGIGSEAASCGSTQSA